MKLDEKRTRLSVGHDLTVDQEVYVHYAECINSLNTAWSILKALQTEGSQSILSAAAFRMALVEYAKPYHTSYGDAQKRHRLEMPTLQASNQKIHKQIMDLRDQVLAHSDLTIKDANLQIQGGRALIVSNSLPQMPKLDDVIDLIERTLDQMYADQKGRLDQLAGSVA
jgi:hypothetical protein